MPEFGGTRAAIGLVRRAGPVKLRIYLGTAVLGGAIPVLVSWLTKLPLDRIATDRVTPAALTRLAIGLALSGIAIAGLPHVVPLPGSRVMSRPRRRLNVARGQRDPAPGLSLLRGRTRPPATADHGLHR